MGMIDAVVPGGASGAGDSPVRTGSVMATPAARGRVVTVRADRLAEVEACVARAGNSRLAQLGLLVAAAISGGRSVYMPTLVVVSPSATARLAPPETSTSLRPGGTHRVSSRRQSVAGLANVRGGKGGGDRVPQETHVNIHRRWDDCPASGS